MNSKRKCKSCNEYNPVEECIKLPGGTFCSYECATRFGQERAEKLREKALAKVKKEQRLDTKRRREALQTKPELTKKAQKAFNAFIRERDKNEPCISCGSNPVEKKGGVFDAGHYRSTGSCPELRFEELNCHKQCVKCNRDLSGNCIEYRIRLKDKIGIDKLDWLEGPHEALNHTHDDLRKVEQYYKDKLKQMRAK